MKIEVKNLTKRFNKSLVVDNVNVIFESGKIYGIIGTNGAGKSVFLKMICSFYKPTTGCILQDGNDYIKNGNFPKNTRVLIEHPDFIPDITGYENLKLLASIQNKISDDEIMDVLYKVNLYEERDKKYKEYSLGMKQKLGIAQVLMEHPDFIILDEPFNAIEEKSVKKIKKELKSLRNANKLIIITSHNKEDIKELADEIFIFESGRMNRYDK